mmetsp:Transcript_57356/g.171057  ORF Transcript_57356/g.171057 Transcript_57356/m.171057 type:complete len:382 (+) Transcript_57356:58-1203(+)
MLTTESIRRVRSEILALVREAKRKKTRGFSVHFRDTRRSTLVVIFGVGRNAWKAPKSFLSEDQFHSKIIGSDFYRDLNKIDLAVLFQAIATELPRCESFGQLANENFSRQFGNGKSRTLVRAESAGEPAPGSLFQCRAPHGAPRLGGLTLRRCGRPPERLEPFRLGKQCGFHVSYAGLQHDRHLGRDTVSLELEILLRESRNACAGRFQAERFAEHAQRIWQARPKFGIGEAEPALFLPALQLVAHRLDHARFSSLLPILLQHQCRRVHHEGRAFRVGPPHEQDHSRSYTILVIEALAAEYLVVVELTRRVRRDGRVVEGAESSYHLHLEIVQGLLPLLVAVGATPEGEEPVVVIDEHLLLLLRKPLAGKVTTEELEAEAL